MCEHTVTTRLSRHRCAQKWRRAPTAGGPVRAPASGLRVPLAQVEWSVQSTAPRAGIMKGAR